MEHRWQWVSTLTVAAIAGAHDILFWPVLFAAAVTVVGTSLVQLAQRTPRGRRYLLFAATAIWAVIVLLLLYATKLAESTLNVPVMVILALLTSVVTERLWRRLAPR